MELAAVEAVGIAGLGHQLLRLHRVVGIRLDGQGELEGAGDDAPGGLRGAERFHLADRPPIDCVVGGQTHALVGPRRLGIPHVEEVDRGDADAAGEGQA